MAARRRLSVLAGLLLISAVGLGAKRVSAPSARRVAANSSTSSTDPQLTEDNAKVFASRAACLDWVTLGHRVTRAIGTARIGAWNVRWFPDGIAGNSPSPTKATDVEWLACSLAFLNVDVIALEEVKSKPRSETALQAIVLRLKELTGDAHGYRIDDCPDSSGQHLAWVWNEARVQATGFQLHAAINPHGDSCAEQLRPGFGLTLKFSQGLDLHAIAVHLKSGTTLRDLELRRQSLSGLSDVVKGVVERSKDADVLVLGDFNTMGSKDSPYQQRGSAELLFWDGRLAAARPALRRLPSELGCSEYYSRKPALLDHFLATRATTEITATTKTETYGHCRDLGCESYSGAAPASMNQLSDHCPIVLSLTDADED